MIEFGTWVVAYSDIADHVAALIRGPTNLDISNQ